LVETKDGLILVDTGLGLRYIANPKLLGRKNFFVIHAPLDPAETAARQIVQLGFAIEDVRHIVLTHLDLDHAGGLPDFPNAQVHVLVQEYEAALHPPTSAERGRYIADQWKHGPKWVVHSIQGEKWYDFDNVQEVEPEVLLVPTIGHTRGHCGVAVKTGEGWLLHCGDTYTHHAEISLEPERCPLGAKLFQRSVPVDRVASLNCQKQVQKLLRHHGKEVATFCSHDPIEFSRFQDSK
jgi:glyoxylase-like metal-dependent hydrolase (beta-lactamase superfamily II)